MEKLQTSPRARNRVRRMLREAEGVAKALGVKADDGDGSDDGEGGQSARGAMRRSCGCDLDGVLLRTRGQPCASAGEGGCSPKPFLAMLDTRDAGGRAQWYVGARRAE